VTIDKASWQVRQVWKRFGGWYGADALERKFGLQPPDDWIDAIDKVERQKLEQIMTDVRAKYPTWMPSLPEFELLVTAANRPVFKEGPTMAERLDAFVLRTKRLTPMQLLGSSWTYLYRGNPHTGEGLVTTGVQIAADGDVPGFRVMAIDMEAEEV
jgi:hypothetical protein